ncbi:MAG: ATP-dependent zinc metalloprotease FtsH [Deltaproteobacteria bacterium]|nr:ATP-dependent zinc metalloprotease FtsH [Deltaproteobacteria bacterium]
MLGSLAKRGVRVTFADVPPDYVGRGEAQPFSVFLAEVQKLKPPTNVVKVSIRGKEITGELKNGEHFITVGELASYRQALIERGVEVTEENESEGSLWLQVLGTWLPMIFIFFIFFMFMRQLQAGGGKAMSFGKSRHKTLNESTNKVTFKDVAGIDEAKEELQEIIHFLKDPKKFTRLGGRIPKGVLLMGPPGTGKTLLAKGVAGEAGVPFFSISGSDFVEMFVGVGASRVRDLFENGKKHAPCIIFIDEIDAVGRHRGAGLGGGHDEREQTLNQLLVEMDGFESNEGVILMAASNRPDVLDPALMRPGRFDRRVVVPRPDVKGREEILRVHTRKTRLGPDVALGVIARGTPGFAGADLENLVNEAALLAARHDKDSVDMEDFESAKDKVLMGAERRSAVMSEEDRWITAIHEAGHAIVARKIPGNDPVHKVTIIPRGMALGLTWTLPEADHLNHSEEQVLARITMAMGGRVAEERVFQRVTTGAGNDIEQATKLARKMVCEWGMSRLGPISLAKNEGSVFLGREIGRSSEYSEQTQAEADAEIRRLLQESYARALAVVDEHHDALERIGRALLEYESLDGPEIDLILAGGGLAEIKAHRAARAASLEGAVAAAAAAAAAAGGRKPETIAPPPKGGDPIVGKLPEPVGGMRQRLGDDERLDG